MQTSIVHRLLKSTKLLPVGEIAKARLVLEQFVASKTQIVEREQVVAYAFLEAWVSHFSKRANERDRKLLKLADVVFEKEKDRFFKQRRIAIAKLAESLGA